MSLSESESNMLSALQTPNSEAAFTSRVFDAFVVVIVLLAVIPAMQIHMILTVGDWDFWVDWKDRLYWLTMTPILLIFVPAALTYAFWEKFRLPLAGTAGALCLTIGYWFDRIFGFHMWSYFPYSLMWPSVVIPSLLAMDLFMILTRSMIMTAIFGGISVGIFFPLANIPLLAPYHIPVNFHGNLVNVADMIGYTFTRTATPEYLRIIERGTLRTFGGESTIVSAVFSGVTCMVVFVGAWAMGKWITNMGYVPNRLKGMVGIKDEDESTQASS